MITAVPREVSVISGSSACVRADAKPYTSFISPYKSAETQSFASRIRPERMQNVTQRVLLALFAGAYAVLVAFTIHLHEPWADEAQSWLLARDASLPQLWGHLLHYEGTPGLWQTVLHTLIRLGLPYSAYSFVSASLGLAAVVLMLRYAPLPLYIRLLLPLLTLSVINMRLLPVAM